MRRTRTSKLTAMAMLIALAFVVTLLGKLIPIRIMFLSYDPKDIIVVIGGFIYGPMAAVIISIISSIIEMITISETGPIGLVMNVLATCAFACPAAIIYKKKHTMKGAVIGLIIGTLAMTGTMILWNYLITPFYTGFPRSEIVKLLLPLFLPFNLIKGGINLGFALLIYKPVVRALRKSGLVGEDQNEVKAVKKNQMGAILLGLFVVATGVLLLLVMAKVI